MVFYQQNLDETQKAAYRVFTSENIASLRRFLDKEEKRARDSETQNINFVARGDDELGLY